MVRIVFLPRTVDTVSEHALSIAVAVHRAADVILRVGAANRNLGLEVRLQVEEVVQQRAALWLRTGLAFLPGGERLAGAAVIDDAVPVVVDLRSPQVPTGSGFFGFTKTS